MIATLWKDRVSNEMGKTSWNDWIYQILISFTCLVIFILNTEIREHHCNFLNSIWPLMEINHKFIYSNLE